MDNLAARKVAGDREVIEARGAELAYLPTYSPHLNPIEQILAELKTLLRRARARTVQALTDTIDKALDAFTTGECTNDIANSGYRRRQRDPL